MTLKDGMLLYHGSYTSVESISLDQCARGKDFGRGFYLTSDLNQAQAFVKRSVKKAKDIGEAPLSQDHGFISSYRFHAPQNNLKVHFFQEANREWLWFVALNRRSNLAEILLDEMDFSMRDADIVVGKIANDTTNPVITTYLNGLYGDVRSEDAINAAIIRLMPEHLVDQYCFLTQRAIDCLVFQEARKYAV